MNEIEERIVAKLGRKPRNLERYVEIYSIFAARPNISLNDAQIKSGFPPATFYRIHRELLNAKLLGEDLYIRSFDLPKQVRMGNLPPVKFELTHLVNYLTKFEDEEIVPPYGVARKEIIDSFKKYAFSDADLASDIIYGLQERLAMLSLISGDLSSFVRMLGTCKPPENLKWRNENG